MFSKDFIYHLKARVVDRIMKNLTNGSDKLKIAKVSGSQKCDPKIYEQESTLIIWVT